MNSLKATPARGEVRGEKRRRIDGDWVGCGAPANDFIQRLGVGRRGRGEIPIRTRDAAVSRRGTTAVSCKCADKPARARGSLNRYDYCRAGDVVSRSARPVRAFLDSDLFTARVRYAALSADYLVFIQFGLGRVAGEKAAARPYREGHFNAPMNQSSKSILKSFDEGFIGRAFFV